MIKPYQSSHVLSDVLHVQTEPSDPTLSFFATILGYVNLHHEVRLHLYYFYLVIQIPRAMVHTDVFTEFNLTDTRHELMHVLIPAGY